MQAVARNCRNQSPRCSREKLKRSKPRGESTEAGHWDGPTRSSDEGSVIGLERRGRVRQLHERNNWKQDELGKLLSTTGPRRLHSQKEWRGKDFGCANCGRSRGADGRQAGN